MKIHCSGWPEPPQKASREQHCLTQTLNVIYGVNIIRVGCLKDLNGVFNLMNWNEQVRFISSTEHLNMYVAQINSLISGQNN